MKNTSCKQLVKTKTYCLKCRKGTENIDPKIEQKRID